MSLTIFSLAPNINFNLIQFKSFRDEKRGFILSIRCKESLRTKKSNDAVWFVPFLPSLGTFKCYNAVTRLIFSYITEFASLQV
jgi:hypothetical protein